MRRIRNRASQSQSPPQQADAQDLDRQIVALEAAGIPPERIYVDKKSGANTNRPGLQAVIEYARDGDLIVVHTLDRLGRTFRDTST